MKKVSSFFKENYKFLLFWLISFFILLVELPYYIDAPGGLINVSDRVGLEESKESAGSFNLAYVTEYKATIPMLILSLFNDDWTVNKKGEGILNQEAYNQAVIRDKLWVKESYANAVILAYERAGKEITITKEEIYAIHIYDEADTDLCVGDKLISIDGNFITNSQIIGEVVNAKKVGDRVEIIVENGGKEYTRYAKIFSIEDRKYIGFVFANIRSYDAIPSIDLKVGSSETGPSGGLMITLAVYDALVDQDMTGGKTIVGTGTIDIDGNVGDIGGVEYKIKGAVKKKADIFFIPAGENHEEAKKIVEENGYKITLVPVSTFDEALDYLLENVAN